MFSTRQLDCVWKIGFQPDVKYENWLFWLDLQYRRWGKSSQQSQSRLLQLSDTEITPDRTIESPKPGDWRSAQDNLIKIEQIKDYQASNCINVEQDNKITRTKKMKILWNQVIFHKKSPADLACVWKKYISLALFWQYW